MNASQVIPSSRESRIVRYTFDERIHHWLAGLSYVYCLITGLAFWSPYLFWLAALVGGGSHGALLASMVGCDLYDLGFVDVQALE